MSKKPQEQMTFDFGFDDDRTSSGSSLPEIVDIGDAEDSLGLPPSGIPDGEESLSFSSPEEYEIDPEEEMEEENDFLSGKEETASGRYRSLDFLCASLCRTGQPGGILPCQ